MAVLGRPVQPRQRDSHVGHLVPRHDDLSSLLSVSSLSPLHSVPPLSPSQDLAPLKEGAHSLFLELALLALSHP
jgi:hypothetical protein